jgi:hypothetical protein
VTPKQRHKGGGRGRGRGEGTGKRKSEEGEILIPVQSKQQKTVQKWGSPLS